MIHKLDKKCLAQIQDFVGLNVESLSIGLGRYVSIYFIKTRKRRVVGLHISVPAPMSQLGWKLFYACQRMHVRVSRPLQFQAL